MRYGGGWIAEHPDWRTKYPQGPVRWDVWSESAQLAENIPANELQAFMVSKELLQLW